MTIRQDQAVALIRALYSIQIAGTDSDGNIYGPERNAHFLDAVRVMYPGLPEEYDLFRMVVLPPSPRPDDHQVQKLKDRQARRKKFSAVLRDIAEAFEADDINCPMPPGAA